jgi:hypothetical protein
MTPETTQDAPPADAPPAEATALGGAAPAALESAPPADAPAAPPAPVALEVKFPEGFAADDALVGKFKPLAQELGLDSPKAQKLVDLFVEAQTAAAQKAEAEVERQHKVWTESLKADKEFGGAEFDASVQVARKAMVKFASPELRTFLEETGLGNHPELVRFAYRIGKSIAEDSVAGTTGAGTQTPQNSDAALHRALYPSMHKE